MPQQVMITRHYSSFRNVADTLSLGNHEYDGRAAMATYILPEGYTADADHIYDDAGYECALVLYKGHVTLISRVGSAPDKILTETQPK